MRKVLWLVVATAGLAAVSVAPAAADFVINDDLIVDGSTCVGFDCVNGESFGYDTIRLKENNLRIKFQDTSVGSFPSGDWTIVANDSSSGGRNAFYINDEAHEIFTLEFNAPSYSLYVDDGGRVGLGTSTPVVELHIVDGDTPALRLQQDGSSGFAQQTWDVAGNETNFFVRDVTNGSTLPFRIRPGAPSSAIFIDVGGAVGFGTSSPTEDVHIKRTTGSQPTLLVEDATPTAGNQIMLHLKDSSGSPVLRYEGSLKTWDMTAGNFFTLNDPNAAGTELQLDSNGNLTLKGDCSDAVGGGGCTADHVFEPEYQLLPLEEVAAFIKENGHLPNIPSAEETKAKGLNLTRMNGRLLEKIEELTLYTLAQQETIQSLEARLAALEARPE